MLPRTTEECHEPANIVGAVRQMFTCTAKTTDQQCTYMMLLEWLERAFAALRAWLEKEAEYNEKHQLGVAALKQFGQLSQGIVHTQKYLKEHAAACGKCRECTHHIRRDTNYLNSETYQLLEYYENYHRPKEVERLRAIGDKPANTVSG